MKKNSITLKNNQYSATILPLGAELETFCKNETNYIWKVDETFWNKTSPVLFPIVGRLKDDKYICDGKTYTLPRHGFARNFIFEVLQQTENSVVFSLQQNAESLEVFPFYFELQLSYVLHNNILTLKYAVKNNSSEKMPYTIGAHPAFAISNAFEEYTLQFDEDELLESHILENELYTGKTEKIESENGKIPLNYDLFATDALVFKSMKNRKVTILHKEKEYLKVNFTDFPHLGVWTKKNAPFLCIEPWLGYADMQTTNGTIFEKKGIQILEPKQLATFSFSMEIM